MVLILILSCQSDNSHHLEELLKDYIRASNNHDIEAMEKMTHDSIIWILGAYTLKGKEAALSPNWYDKGVGTSLEYHVTRIQEDTIECEFFERSPIISSVGMECIKQFPRFIFQNGKLIKKEPWKISSDLAKLNQLSAPKRKWIRENYPDVIKQLIDANGNFIFSEENGKLMAQMSKEWEKAMQSPKRSNK